MNLEAALLPIGSIAVPVGLSVQGPTVSMQETSVVAGFAQGDTLITALKTAEVMVVDSLGGNFMTSAEQFVVKPNNHDESERFALFVNEDQSRSGMASALKAVAMTLNQNGMTHVVGGSTSEVMSDFGLVSEHTGLLFSPITMSEIPTDSHSIGVQGTLGQNSQVAAYVYSSGGATLGDTQGIGVALQLGQDDNQLSVGASIMQESGAALGMQSYSARSNLAATSQAIDLGYSADLNDNVSFTANAQIGSSTSSAQGFWGEQQNTSFNAYGMAVTLENVFSGDEIITASLRHPIAIDSGTMTMVIPQSRDIEGNITSSQIDIDLAPEARQLDLGLEYQVGLTDTEFLKIGAAYIMNAGNFDSLTSLDLAISYSLSF